MRQLITTAAFVAILVGLGGCAAAGPDEGAVPDPASPELIAEGRAAVVTCLQERGWDVTLEVDGWSSTGITDAQADAYGRDQDECTEESGLNDIPVAPLTPERLAEIYAHEVESAECLRAEGYEIPETPSEQSFSELYTTEKAWYAYRFVEEPSQEKWSALQVTCPQFGG